MGAPAAKSGAPDSITSCSKVWTDEEKRQKLYNWEFQLTEKEPLWDAADGMRFGKDIFHQCSSVTNKGGMIPYEHVIPFSGALHCTTLDVYREGTCEDYFPKQIEGY
jgi:hypothetical protein